MDGMKPAVTEKCEIEHGDETVQSANFAIFGPPGL